MPHQDKSQKCYLDQGINLEWPYTVLDFHWPSSQNWFRDLAIISLVILDTFACSAWLVADWYVTVYG